MKIVPLTDGLAVAGQISPADLPGVAEAGYRLVIGNRPDGEEPGQPSAAEVEAAAQAAGIGYWWLPVTGPTIDVPTATAFVQRIAEAEGPVLAHCRSGSRTTILWALGEVATGARTPAEVVEIAGRAGYDLHPYLPKLAAAMP